jgi:hypothetical protein
VDAEPPTLWRYTTTPPPENWFRADFDDSAWATGQAGFGQKGGWESRIRTPWTTPDLWLRTTLDYDGQSFDEAVFILHYDNATEVYVNGEETLRLTGWNDAYAPFNATRKLRGVLRRGRNVLAVHVHQDTGGQFIDLALLLGSSSSR